MPRFIHDGSADFIYLIIHHLRALHLPYHRGIFHMACEDDSKLVPFEVVLFGQHCDPIRIPVIGESDVAFTKLGFEVAQILLFARIGMVVGKVAVGIAVEPFVAKSELLKNGLQHHSRHTVAAIGHDTLRKASQMREIFHHIGDVALFGGDCYEGGIITDCDLAL